MQFTDEKGWLIQQIVALELDMFVNVKTSEPAPCQEKLRTFKLMRRMSHSALSLATLKSYLSDLQAAVMAERNLITEKYARMDNQIPLLNDNPLIQHIVSSECEWLAQLHEQYPLAVKCDENFKRYALGELETYSNRTLTLLYQDVCDAANGGHNLVEARYEYLYKSLGYLSLADVENKARHSALFASGEI